MILGIGSDLVDTKRIESLLKTFNQRFKNRVFTPQEQAYCEAQHYTASSYAKRFAAKEACAKALGLGFQNGVRWIDIEVLNNAQGKPSLTLKGKALLHLTDLLKDLPKGAKPHLNLSLCDEGFLAHAFVVISYQ
ncbi:MAG: holo-ACP synthase [Proteobacteria bacterium]|nr:holo-ACP synthase [Pseudomonadota bacterium]